jgi:Kef-type K+ transport system membrane component KefB
MLAKGAGMPDLLAILAGLSWPFAITLAWLAGEFGQRWSGLPRISFYGLAGFLLAAPQLGVLPRPEAGTVLPLADVAFGLILFELGYRINLRWLRTDPWIVASGLAEALLTFAAVYFIARSFGATGVDALMLASLSMATSPATVVRVINEQKSSGQVTERALHLCALDCVLAVFAFNASVGLWIFRSSEDAGGALWNSLVVLGVSAFAGAVFGLLVPAVLRMLGKLAHDATVAFALAVILLVAIAHTLKLSPVVATLVFGLVERHRRADFSQAQHNFGALGELLTVVLFVFAGATLDWRNVAAGGGMAVVLVLARLAGKLAGVTAFAHLSGISWRKGALIGAALAPLSVFLILLIEHARRAGVQVAAELHSLAAVTMLLEMFGPIIVQRALVRAREAPEPSHAA